MAVSILCHVWKVHILLAKRRTMRQDSRQSEDEHTETASPAIVTIPIGNEGPATFQKSHLLLSFLRKADDAIKGRRPAHRYTGSKDTRLQQPKHTLSKFTAEGVVLQMRQRDKQEMTQLIAGPAIQFENTLWAEISDNLEQLPNAAGIDHDHGRSYNLGLDW